MGRVAIRIRRIGAVYVATLSGGSGSLMATGRTPREADRLLAKRVRRVIAEMRRYLK